MIESIRLVSCDHDVAISHLTYDITELIHMEYKKGEPYTESKLSSYRPVYHYHRNDEPKKQLIQIGTLVLEENIVSKENEFSYGYPFNIVMIMPDKTTTIRGCTFDVLDLPIYIKDTFWKFNFVEVING